MVNGLIVQKKFFKIVLTSKLGNDKIQSKAMPIKLGKRILGGKIMNREEGHHSGQPVCLHCGSCPCDRLFRDSDFHRRRNGLRLICGCVRYADGRILAEIYQAPQKNTNCWWPSATPSVWLYSLRHTFMS